LQTKAPFLTIGTRGSPLARAQAEEARRELAGAAGVKESDIAIAVFTTSGDKLTDRPLSEAGGKGLFTKEIETALIEGAVDVAVHSAKDLETELPPGLVIGACLRREDVRDALISREGVALDELPKGARLGTSSIRRMAQMKRHRRDLDIIPFRGNVGTRLRKLDEGLADATLLAAAGLNRLGEADLVTDYLDPAQFPPAPGQGVVVLQHRANDTRIAGQMDKINDARSMIELAAERAMLSGLDGSCRTPIGAYSDWAEGRLLLTGEILEPDGSKAWRANASGAAADAAKIGRDVAARIRGDAGSAFFAALARR
jgi:hydroxymethylbilane synthase